MVIHKFEKLNVIIYKKKNLRNRFCFNLSSLYLSDQRTKD